MNPPSPVWAAAGGVCIAVSGDSRLLLVFGLLLVAVYVVRWAVAR